jgi:hypothetical protein
MEDVEFPVLGIDNKGNKRLMQPGEEEINFPGDTVLEFKLDTKNKDRIYNRIFKR